MEFVYGLLGLAAVGTAASLIGAKVLYDRTLPRQEQVRVNMKEFADEAKLAEYQKIMVPNKEWYETQTFEEIAIKSNDGLKLVGYYLPAENPSDKIMIGCHGYTSHAMQGYLSHARFFHDQGYDVLIVDARAHGKSEGKYVGFGILDRFDLLEWIRYVNKRFGEDKKILLHGTSMGATTVLMTSGFDEIQKYVKGIIADCAFTSPYDIFSHVLKKDYHLPPFPIMNINNVMCKKKAGYIFKDYSTLDALKTNKSPVLFIHGSEDKFVPTKMSKLNYDTAVCEKKMLVVEGAAHGSSCYENKLLYEETEKEFVSKYFD
ncbi:MAG: alpha/beta hydrolase [Oscillospiraceae bacterium]